VPKRLRSLSWTYLVGRTVKVVESEVPSGQAVKVVKLEVPSCRSDHNSNAFLRDHKPNNTFPRQVIRPNC